MRHPAPFRAATLALSCFLALAAGVSAHPGQDERIARATERIASDPRDARLLLSRAELHRQHDDPAAALADYAAARGLDPQLAVIDLCLGQLFLEQGEPGVAVGHLDAYLRAFPANGDALALRGRARSGSGNLAGAAEDLTAAIAASDRPSPDLWIDRARTLARMGDARVDEALRGLDEGLARLGPVVSLQVETVDLAVNAGRLDEALRRLESLAASSPRPESWHVRRGELLEAAGRGPEAHSAYRAALAALAGLPQRTQASLGARRAAERARLGLLALAATDAAP